MSTLEQKIEALTQNEAWFTKNVAIPILHHLGFKRIRYVHGADEHGRDLVFFDVDRFGNETLNAAQIKFGNIKGTQKKKIQCEIIPQLLEALRQPYRDQETGKTHSVSRVYLIISGELIGTAKSQFHSALEREPNITVIDRQTIDWLANRDGIDTMFGIHDTKNESMLSTGNSGGLPRLPLMHAGMSLDVGLYLDEIDFATDSLTISHVAYNPLFRSQVIYFDLVDLPSSHQDVALQQIYKNLEESSAYLWEALESCIKIDPNDL